MKPTKLFLLFLFLSLKGLSQQAVLTSSGEKVILNFLSSSGGTITGTLGVTGNTTISGTTTLTGVNNTGTITNTGAFINNGDLTVNGNGTITGTLTTSGAITAGGMQNTPIGSSIANTGAFTTLSASGATTITGTLTLPSLSASTLLGTNGSSQLGTVSLTGDITTIGLVATLSNTGVIVGTYGSSTTVPQITVDSKGRITTITTTIITAGGGTTHTISETFGGGIVFYVTTDGLHGLIAETQNQSTDSDWYVAHDIISNPANHSYEGQKFIDWRLPTKYELNLMFNARSTIGGFTNNYYWSSTESDFNVTTNNRESWLQNMSSGTPFKTFSSTPFYVRAIRAF